MYEGDHCMDEKQSDSPKPIQDGVCVVREWKNGRYHINHFESSTSRTVFATWECG